MRRWIPTAAVATVGVALAAGCGGGDSDSATPPTSTPDVTDTSEVGSGAIAASVGPGFVISMNKAEVAAGSYTLTADDKADDHNFRLTGPGGVDVATEVSEIGVKTFEVDLEAGTYTFVCDPHVSSMKGTLTVK